MCRAAKQFVAVPCVIVRPIRLKNLTIFFYPFRSPAFVWNVYPDFTLVVYVSLFWGKEMLRQDLTS